ncbi:MAG: hypothetical protein ACXW6R_14750 [Candidatus Binatia bacterium]
MDSGVRHCQTCQRSQRRIVVDFPKFVGGLIKNVFQAIVESSIEQMRDYGELIGNVAKTVEQFMTDNISAGADSFAGDGELPVPTAQLVARGENAEARVAEISRDLNPLVSCAGSTAGGR